MKKLSTVIIAEAGVNHNGSMETALRLIDAAAEAGADIVKFQSFSASKLVTGVAEKADYQKRTTGEEESQHDMLSKLELTHGMHEDLMNYAAQKNIKFLSTGFDIESINMLMNLGSDFIKIPSGEATNIFLLRHVGSLGKPILLSTGMCTLGDIESAIGVLTDAGAARDQICVLHCSSAYPARVEDVNLLAMKGIKRSLNVDVGYSDHTAGIDVPVAAVALGATVIEKHLTLDRNMRGPDHIASLEPQEFAVMVSSIRNVERALGDGLKRPSVDELSNRKVSRRSLVAARVIEKGETLSEENVCAKRPGTGISPMMWAQLNGHIAPRRFEKDELLTL